MGTMMRTYEPPQFRWVLYIDPIRLSLHTSVARCFANARGRLGEPDGPVVALLQAYLTMVPDIQYHRGQSQFGVLCNHLLTLNPLCGQA